MLLATQSVGDRAGLDLGFLIARPSSFPSAPGLLSRAVLVLPGLTAWHLPRHLSPVGKKGGREGLARWEVPIGVS